SFSLALSAAGVKPTDMAKIDLRPAALRSAYYTTQGKIVKFYENIRFVYEIESRVREFKRSTTPAEPGPEKPRENRNNNNKDTSGQPDQNQEQNYSREENQPVLAELVNQDVLMISATSYEPRATSKPDLTLGSLFGAGSSGPEARGSNMPPDVTVTTNRRFV